MSLYRRIAPFGSRRDRLVWISLVTIRKLREGPGPWLRAVRKGLYQLLPTHWQQRVLRWTGKDRFFRREGIRHAGAAAGVERRGMVSVVLPVFDQRDLIADAIDSVLAQSHRSLELIVVDDGSTDEVLPVLRRYLDDPRVHVLTQPNQGLPKALSTGFEHATGEFFTWTSADNVMHPEQLERLVSLLQRRPDVAMVYADYELIDEHGDPLRGGEFRVMDRTDKRNLSAVRVNRSTHDLNRYEDNFIGGCFLYRGQVGRLLGDYNPELGLEDYDYWMRINRLFCIEHLGTDELLYRYRVHDNTLSARARELKILERAKVLMQYERRRAEWCDAPFDACPDGSGRKVLLRPTADELTGLSTMPSAPNEAIATWFEQPEQAHRAHMALQRLPVAAFTDDEDTAARLAVYTRSVFRAEARDAIDGLAERYASNITFFRTTRDADRLQRIVPQPIARPRQQPLRVLLQLDAFGKGGLERVALDLATCWRSEGCEVGLLALDGRPGDVPTGIEVVERAPRDDDGYREMLARGGWHLVSAHASTFGAAVAKEVGVPFVQVVHNSYVWFDRDQIEAYRSADAHTAAYACVSAPVLGYADLRLRLDVSRMLVIENGIESRVAVPTADETAARRREFGLDDDDFVFLQVASIQPAKAHLVALRALASLREHEPSAKLLCLGNDRMHPLHAARVRGEIDRLGLGDAVVLAGHRDDADAFYALADAFVLPSYWEGCSLAVWEAIRADLPLVLSDVGAAREQLRHGRGQRVKPPFRDAFALDASNLAALVDGEHESYAGRLMDAMRKVMAEAADGHADRDRSGLPRMADRDTMARRHLLLYRWLLQGGEVAGIRRSIARAAEDAIAT